MSLAYSRFWGHVSDVQYAVAGSSPVKDIILHPFREAVDS